ncbi:hypothetical protein OH76DRAFT_1489908 [Lentinus brumalis]|uniref:Uncharacterized protein n=1 Tax=Lentinus brumalis TaxID=2498619 RepID=A0A371CKT7_9APHY|nr:hypothetical protein OH76DRAFT_1489908 [Polyporus brumalis]
MRRLGVWFPKLSLHGRRPSAGVRHYLGTAAYPSGVWAAGVVSTGIWIPSRLWVVTMSGVRRLQPVLVYTTAWLRCV